MILSAMTPITHRPHRPRRRQRCSVTRVHGTGCRAVEEGAACILAAVMVGKYARYPWAKAAPPSSWMGRAWAVARVMVSALLSAVPGVNVGWARELVLCTSSWAGVGRRSDGRGYLAGRESGRRRTAGKALISRRVGFDWCMEGGAALPKRVCPCPPSFYRMCGWP